MKLSHKVSSAIAKVWLRVFIRWEVTGKENVPVEGPLIVVSNHLHLMDPPLLILSLPRWISFMAKEELFHSWFSASFCRWAQAFPVRRVGTLGDRKEALQQAKEMLGRGLVLGIFPEGKRSREARLLPGHAGSVLIAARTGVPIIPVGIAGTEKLKGINWLRRPRITVNIGRPFRLPQVDGRVSKAQSQLFVNLVMEQIAAVLPPEYRGDYDKATEPLDGAKEYGK